MHPDGREVVYDGDTGKVVTDPALKGTYNYVNMRDSYRKIRSKPDLYRATARAIGHLFADILPYEIGGNVRGDE